MSQERRQRILDVINDALRGASGRVDAEALATAIDAALGADTLEAGPAPADVAGPPGAGSSPKGAYFDADEGKTPDQLNAANDE
jgi:hypothetical protein